MKYKILLITVVAACITSCSTYKAGQTPDDVYYSPAREGAAQKEVRTNDRRDRYDEYVGSADDRYLRMKIQNRDRWSAIDDYSYWYDSRYNYYNDYSYNNYYSPYSYMYNNPFGHNIYTSFNTWNTFGYNPWLLNYYGYGSSFGGYYSPGYPVIYYKNPRVYTATTGRPNLNTYSNSNYNNSNNNRQSFGETMRRVFTNDNGYSNSNYSNSNSSSSSSNSSNNSSYTAPVRSYTPAASSSSSGSSSSGAGSGSSGGSVSRPGRGN